MHIEKYEKTAVGHLLKHYSREAKHYSNQDIDLNRTGSNYNLCPHQDAFSYYRQRLSEVKCQNRQDVKTLCDWVVTLPKQSFTEEQERKFFEEVYQFLEKKYGTENIVSAWVHKDEAGQPHLHFAFIPVVYEKKKGRYKVSAKEAITKKDLQLIHPQIEAHLSEALGMAVAMLNGATIAGNKSIEELKQYEDRLREYHCLVNETKRLETEVKEQEKQVQSLTDREEQLLSYFGNQRVDIPHKKKKNILGKEVVEVDAVVWDKFEGEHIDLVTAARFAEDQMDELKECKETIARQNQTINVLFNQRYDLSEENKNLKQELLRIRSRFDVIMKELHEFFPNVRGYLKRYLTKNVEKQRELERQRQEVAAEERYY